MKKFVWAILPGLIMAFGVTMAQDAPKTEKEKKEIIIEEKGSSKNEKTVIVIDGDKVTVNGKPAKDYKGKKMIIVNEDIIIDGDRVVATPKGKAKQLAEAGKRALLGVVTEKDEKGAIITSVSKESAAEKAGLKEGDIITGVNEQAIAGPDDLIAAIGKQKPDDAVDVEYLRDGKSKKVKATLGRNPASMAYSWRSDMDRDFNFYGQPPMAMVSPRMRISPDFPQKFKWNEEDMWIYRDDRPKYGLNIEDNPDGSGVKITGLEVESNALKAGLQKDDLITAIDGKPIKGVDELREQLAESKDNNSVDFTINRKGAEQKITVKVPKKIKKAEL